MGRYNHGRRAEAEYWDIMQEKRPQKIVKYKTPYFLRAEYRGQCVQMQISREYIKKYNEDKIRLFFEPALILKLKKTLNADKVELNEIIFSFCEANKEFTYTEIKERVS